MRYRCRCCSLLLLSQLCYLRIVISVFLLGKHSSYPLQNLQNVLHPLCANSCRTQGVLFWSRRLGAYSGSCSDHYQSRPRTISLISTAKCLGAVSSIWSMFFVGLPPSVRFSVGGPGFCNDDTRQGRISLPLGSSPSASRFAMPPRAEYAPKIVYQIRGMESAFGLWKSGI